MVKDWSLWKPVTPVAMLAAEPETAGLPTAAAMGAVRRRMAELRQHIAHARTVEQRIESVTREVEDMILAILAEDARSGAGQGRATGAYLNP